MFRILAVLLFAAYCHAGGQNYADQLLQNLERETASLLTKGGPVEKLLLAEDIYYLGHETSRQGHIAALLFQIFESVQHPELKAELGYILTQQYRQLGEYGKVEELVKGLGYVSEWQVLGPLSPNRNLSMPRHVSARRIQGLDRTVRPHVIRTYGPEGRYWDQGIGQYGFFSANHAVYPNQLAGALFSTWFYLPRSGAYRLGLGWSHYLRAWINRTPVFEGTEDQRPHPDQAAVRFELKKGWHRLSLYIESDAEDPMLGFFARMTDLAGNPLQFQAKKGRGLSKKKPKLVDSGESLLEIAEKRSPYALASILLTKEQINHSRFGNPRQWLDQAFAEAPNRLVIEKIMTLTEDPNERWRYLSAFLERLEGNDRALDKAWTLTQLGQIALGQNRFWEARHFAERAMAAHAGYWPARVLENNTFASLGLDGEALRHTRELAADYPHVPWIMMDLCDLYASLNFLKESEMLTAEILKIRSGNAKFSERQIKFLKSRGDSAALDGLYGDLMKDAPYSVAIIRAYSRFLMANGKFDKAQSLLARSLDQLPENPFLLESMGELKLRLEQPDALEYLEKALALRPQNPDLEKLIAFSKSGETAFYKPFRLEKGPDLPILEISSVAVNFDITVRKVAPNGQSSVFHQIEYEILEDRANQELPGYSFSYAPLRQKAEILKAEIYRGGSTVYLTNFGRRRISDPAYRMYYDLVSYQIPFPTLRVGDRVRIEYRIDDIDSHNIFGDYFGELHYFAGHFPTRRLAYTLIMPQDRNIHYHAEKMDARPDKKIMGENVVYTWTLDQVSAYETESRMPGLSSYLPYLGISTFSDWQEMAQWYSRLIKDQMILNNETKKIVAELTRGVTDRLEIVKRIHEFVITHTRYVALEFGIHGYKPYEVNQVCTRQFGDCKDKAILIAAMLREAGIEASIAIVRTSDEGDIHPFPAMLSYFNHAITYVPEFDLYLDGTAEFSGIHELPAMDQGALTLVVDQDGNGTLTKIPIKEENHQGVHLNLEVTSDGAAKVRGELSYLGVRTPELRQYLSIDEKLTQNLQKLLAERVPGLDLMQADREGRQINDPITLTFEGVSRQLVQVGEGKMKLPLSILNSQLTQAYAPNAHRKFPLDFGVPNTQSVQVRVEVPLGYTLADFPTPLEIEDKNLKVHIKVNEEKPREWVIDYQLAFKTPRVDPGDYLALRSMMQAHDRVLDQALQFVVQ